MTIMTMITMMTHILQWVVMKRKLIIMIIQLIIELVFGYGLRFHLLTYCWYYHYFSHWVWKSNNAIIHSTIPLPLRMFLPFYMFYCLQTPHDMILSECQHCNIPIPTQSVKVGEISTFCRYFLEYCNTIIPGILPRHCNTPGIMNDKTILYERNFS